MSIRTVRTDGRGRFQSVHDQKIASHEGDLECIRRLTGVKGVSRVVDPYGPYRWNRPFSIRIRSENCISLSGLEYISLLTGVKWGSQVVDPYGPYKWNRAFSIRHDRKIASH